MIEVQGDDDVPFPLQKWMDLIPRFNTSISLTKPSTWCSQAFWPGQWGSCTLSMSAEIRKTKTLWLFLASLTSLTFQITLQFHEAQYAALVSYSVSAEAVIFHRVLQLTGLPAHWFINSKWTHSFILLYSFWLHMVHFRHIPLCFQQRKQINTREIQNLWKCILWASVK